MRYSAHAESRSVLRLSVELVVLLRRRSRRVSLSVGLTLSLADSLRGLSWSCFLFALFLGCRFFFLRSSSMLPQCHVRPMAHMPMAQRIVQTCCRFHRRKRAEANHHSPSHSSWRLSHSRLVERLDKHSIGQHVGSGGTLGAAPDLAAKGAREACAAVPSTASHPRRARARRPPTASH